MGIVENHGSLEDEISRFYLNKEDSWVYQIKPEHEYI